MKAKLLMSISAALFLSTGFAYKETTHADISRFAVQNSVMNGSEGRLLDLGLGASASDPRFALPTSAWFGYPMSLTVQQLVMLGARNEDHGKRSKHHFYDPQQGGVGLRFILGDPSPEWALEDTDEDSGQFTSWKDARAFLRDALVAGSASERAGKLARVFESLGHVVHHIQDMHQPQHVRNDIHCDDTPFFFFIFPLSQGCDSLFVPGFIYRPSAYEQYVWEQGIPPMAGYPIPDFASFAVPRDFWARDGKGGAEFTSHNFVSAGSNFILDISSEPIVIRSEAKHPLPRGEDARLVDADINDPSVVRRVTSPTPMIGQIAFVETPVIDRYVASFSAPNARTSTLSIWYDALALVTGEVVTTPMPVFTLNSVNYQAAMERLVPRAAAYSTAMLNYFFRGRIEIGLPDDGVFSVIDHAVTNAAGQGFKKLKVKLRNATAPGVKPDGTSVQQEMPAGKLTAIAKYIVNPCYQPDLLGEYDGGPIDFVTAITRNGCTLEDYFGGIEEIAVSAELAGQSLDREEAQEVTFDFSQQPIPIDAHDLSLQIVYEGVLGNEQDAVVVSGRNLSEPTYISLINGSDYFGIDGELYTPEEIRARADLRSRIGAVNIDPEPLVNVTMSVAGMPIAGVGTLPAKGHHRIAVLTDAEFQAPETGPAPIQVEIRSRFSSGPLGITTLVGPPIRNQLARAPATLAGISIERRGITSWMSLYRFKQLAGSVITAEKIDALPPMDPTCFDGANWSCVPSPAPIEVASQ